MSDRTIYNALRAGGLSRTGVCAMMGNWAWESSMISTNVEDRCSIPDAEYTAAVDNGSYTKEQFMYDPNPMTGRSQNFGYGLAQWTLPSRKGNLYDFAKSKGVSIGDEQMQCEFCIWELTNESEYAGLYKFLCVTDNLAEAAKRICSQYERPAVNNYADRINAAQRYFNLLAGSDSCEDSCPIEQEQIPACKVDVRVLCKGFLGRDVFLLQAGLLDMGYDCGLPDGDFGCNTEEAVKELQRANNIEPTGVADWFVWQTILSER